MRINLATRWLLALVLALAGLAVAQANTWESEILAYEQQDRLFPPPAGAIVVTGSSTIARWGSIRNDLAPLEIIPRGFGGSTADDLDFYLERIVLTYAPRAVVIYEGENDIAQGLTPQYVATRIAQIAGRISARLPSARVYVISIKPSPLRWGVWPQMQLANQLLAEFCASDPRYRYIDTVSTLLGADGWPRPEYFTSDTLHLSAAGYTAWTNSVRPVLLSREQSGIVSDDFDGVGLNGGIWTLVDPRGDSQLTMTGTAARISGPAGTSHDLWKGQNAAPRIMQLASDTDFEIEVKFKTGLSGGNEMQGVLVEADSQNYIRFDFYSNGNGTRIFAASFLAGTPSVRKNSVISGVPSPSPLYLRVKRSGNQWSQSYSLDGSNWVSAVSFSHALTVRRVGAFAGNAVNNPAFASEIDYFRNRSADTTAPGTGTTPTAENRVANPGFESGTSPWTFYSNGSAVFANDAAGQDSAKAAHVAIRQPGTNVQLYQTGRVLEANTQYKLTFKAYSNTGHDVAISLLKHASPYTNYGLSKRVFNLTTSWQTFSIQFATSGFVGAANDARLMFALDAYDAAGDQYYFDDVTLTKVP